MSQESAVPTATDSGADAGFGSGSASDAEAALGPAVLNGFRGELAQRCGIDVVAWDGTHLTGTMPVEGNRQPFGLLHGGASGVLAETLGSIHANLLGGPDRVAVGIELNCTHHRSATSGLVTGVSSALHAGRTLVTLQIAISDEAGRPVCTSRLTCMLRATQ